MSQVYTIEREQLVNAPLHQTWKFFSDPENLAIITPPDLGFRVLSKTPEKIHNDLKIRYKVRPLLGIPVTWETLIKDVSEFRYFTDIQLKGPYAMWEHRHDFYQDGDRTIVKDEVRYKMPFGLLGRIMHFLVVRRRLKKIFEYRQSVLDKLYNA